MTKQNKPRQSIINPAAHFDEGTWLESEGYCGSRGGAKRRARAKMPDGSLRVLFCGASDSFYSIPVKGGKGYLTIENNVLIYQEGKKAN